MRYSRFEALVLTIGVAAIAGSLFLSPETPLLAEEVIAQFLLLGVLFGAVHWGRTGGFIAAVGASLIYVIMRIPLVAGAEGISPEILSLLLVRIVTYGLIGVVGGELCSRIRSIFERLEDSSAIDEWSQVFNQRFITRALDNASGQFARYDTPYSVIVIELSDRIFAELRSSKQRTLVRGIAVYVRGDIRLVDEAGRLDDGRFLIVLPHTARDGAIVVADRLHAGVCDVLGAKEESVVVSVLSADDNAPELQSIRDHLSSEPNGALESSLA